MFVGANPSSVPPIRQRVPGLAQLLGKELHCLAMMAFPVESARRIVSLALAEDVGNGDITCRSVVPAAHRSRARIVAKASGIFAGAPLVHVVLTELHTLDPRCGAHDVVVANLAQDGQVIEAGTELVLLEGPTRAILQAERTILNFWQHLCGVATSAHRYQSRVGEHCKVLDTRKTTPGQRLLEKWAIAQGGGSNHRLGLWDAILIKENHAGAAGGVLAAAQIALESVPQGFPVIVEVRDLQELEQLLPLPLTRVLLDNFTPAQIRQARTLRDRQGASFALEASGGITLDTIAAYAEAGAEFISVGALTHSVMPVDLSLLLTDLPAIRHEQ